MPLSNPLAEEERTTIEPHASFPEEAEPVQLRVRFSSSTSSGEQMGCNSINHFIGSEIHGSQVGHGDSGVEADLGHLNLHEDDASDYPAQELVEETTVCQKSINFTATTGQGTQDSVNSRKPGLSESRTQVCQRRKGKSMKRKEVMMSFGMVKYDGGVKQEQKNMTKGGEKMEDRQHSPFTMQIEDKALKPKPQRQQN